MNTRAFDLTDEEWNHIKSYFPYTRGRPYKNIRRTVNGVLWLIRTNSPVRDLPKRYGKWNAVYKCLIKWNKQGIFDSIFENLGINKQFSEHTA